MNEIVKSVGRIVWMLFLMGVCGAVGLSVPVFILMHLGLKWHRNYEYYGNHLLLYLGPALICFLAPLVITWLRQRRAGGKS